MTSLKRRHVKFGKSKRKRGLKMKNLNVRMMLRTEIGCRE